jgi:hypothetical protein
MGSVEDQWESAVRAARSLAARALVAERRECADVVLVLALAIWRAALDCRCSIAEVELSVPLRWLGGAPWEELFTAPLPADVPHPSGLAWQAMIARPEITQACEIFTAHTLDIVHATGHGQDSHPVRVGDLLDGPMAVALAAELPARES